MLPGRDRQLTTAAVTVGMILSALEATAVAAAVPTAVGGMGEIGRYSWVFSAYLLTSTITIPLFGKLADLYGRKRTYVVSVVIFLVGSCLCGVAQTLPQLAAFRAIQGVGAGGMLPISSVILGDIFSLEERGRMQALFSAVWAFASLVGPLVGGFLTDTLSWRWIFFLNLPFGFVSIALLVRHFREEPPPREHGLDVWGTAALAASAALLLMGLIEGGHAWGFGDPRTIGMFVGSAIALAWFLKLQRRTPEPTLPLEIFSNRVIAVSSLGNATLGATLYALTAFVPLFGQAVLGGTATDAGKLLTPLLVGWPIASTIAGRMIGRMSYRRMAVLGGLFLSVGALALASMGPNPHRFFLPTVLFAFGLGLGFLSMPYFLGVQNAVPWRLRGVASGSVQFFRSIGGAVGVAALGALLSAQLAGSITGDPNVALDSELRAALSSERLLALTNAYDEALSMVFVVVAAIALVSLMIAAFFPAGRARDLAHTQALDERDPPAENRPT